MQRLWVCFGAAILGVLFLSQQLRANTSPAPREDPQICDLASGGCLQTPLQQSARLIPLAAEGNRVLAGVVGPSGAAEQLRLYAYDIQTGFNALGALPWIDGVVRLQGEAAYLLEEQKVLHVYGLANPSRPTLMDQASLPAGPAVDLALIPSALYLARAGPAGGLDVYTLAQPTRPVLATHVTGGPWRRLLAAGVRLYAASTSGLTVLDVSDPMAPQVLSSAAWFSGTVQSVEVAQYSGVVYLMAAGSGSEWQCRVVEISQDGAQADGGACPFPPGRTTFFKESAWVNPNLSSAQFLDYERYSLTEPRAPTLAGLEPLRFSHALPADDLLLAASLDGRLAVMDVNAQGRLEVKQQTWSAEEVSGVPLLFAAGSLIADGGPRAGVGRTLQMVDLSGQTAPRVVGALNTQWSSVGEFYPEGGLLANLVANRITLFDVREPSRPTQLGQIAPPPPIRLEMAAWGSDGRLYASSASNTVLAFNVANPLTPTLQSMIDFPGNSRSMAAVPGALYLFGEESFMVLDTVGPGAPRYVKTIPGVAQPAAHVAFMHSLLLLQGGTILTLDVSNPLVPTPVETADALAPATNEELVDLLPVQDGRFVVLARRTADSDSNRSPEDSYYVAKVFELLDPRHSRHSATIGPLPTRELVFGGDFLVLPDLTTYAVGPQRLVTARVSATSTVEFAPARNITYTFPADAFSTSNTHDEELVREQAICVEDVTLPGQAIAPGRQVAYTAVHQLRVTECDSGVTLTPGLPVSITVEYGAVGDGRKWPDSRLEIDAGEGWQPAQGASNRGRFLTAALLPFRPWAVVGPPPPPELLPLIRRR